MSGLTDIERLASAIKESQRILVFTGAGISTESGISDYRSRGGLWKRFQPVTIQEFIASQEKRREYWAYKLELMEALLTAEPNKGHCAIDALDKMGKLKGIVTQNIDGLQQMAGTSPEKILELHGTNRESVCLSCFDITPFEESYDRIKNGEDVPRCLKCNGLLKPNTISFGQTLDEAVLERSMNWATDCDMCLAMGSTLIVEPAATIPRIAKQYGAKLMIITMSETPLDDLADIKIDSSVGETLSQAVELASG